MTYTATFKSGWRATVVAESRDEAKRRLAMTGRGEKFTLSDGGAHNVWGRDEDDDYEDGE